jgi:hypothetical protein
MAEYDPNESQTFNNALNEIDKVGTSRDILALFNELPSVRPSYAKLTGLEFRGLEVTENRRFQEVRNMLPTDPDSDPFYKQVDLLKESGFTTNQRKLHNDTVEASMHKAASLKMFDSEMFNIVDLTPVVWKMHVKPYLESNVRDIKKLLKDCVAAKILFPNLFREYIIPDNRMSRYFFNNLYDLVNEKKWNELLPTVEKLKFLGWEDIGPTVKLTHNDWISILEWVNQASETPLGFARRVVLANLIRPKNEQEIKLTELQWSDCKNNLSTSLTKGFDDFLDKAKMVKYVQIS